MHDLNTIHRLNEEAVATSQAQALAATGKWVLRRYSGLHLRGQEAYDTAHERDLFRAAWDDSAPDARSEVFNPGAVAGPRL